MFDRRHVSSENMSYLSASCFKNCSVVVAVALLRHGGGGGGAQCTL